jgi:modulator of FtsH protease HflC
MRNNRLTVVVGAILLVIFFLLLFTFQVRQTDVVVVTTFGKPTRTETEPGLKFKWPYPIQQLTRFDNRIQNFEDDFEETFTKDSYSLLAMVYVGWRIADPSQFFNSFPKGDPEAAHPHLKALIRTAKNAAVGQHSFSDFISTDAKLLKFVEVEQEMLNSIKDDARKRYGIEIKFLGIKKLGLPESVTQKVLDRMTAERQREVDRLKALGESEAIKIKSEADLKRDTILAEADRKATEIRGQADAEAAQSFKAFNENPDLALFLLNMKGLEEILKTRSTLILDERTSPFQLLKAPAANGNAQGSAPQSSGNR